MDDTDLVLAARSGDRDALAAIYDRYADRLHDYCWSILRDPHEAADAFHDAFVAAAQRLGQLREPAKLRPWLYAIARHESMRRARARGRQTPTDQMSDMPVTDVQPDDGARREDAVRLVWDAAAGLTDRDRALLDLNLRHNLEGQELADAIGVDRGHAYVLLNRLRAQVERSLGALLVARYGRADCEELTGILAEWDGQFSPLVRKRVARHADQCETCSERRRKMASPLALLSAMPLMPAPALLRDRVLDDARLASHAGRMRTTTADGFPPSPYRRRGRRLSAAGAALLLVLAAVLLLPPSSRDDQGVAVTAVEATTTTASPQPALVTSSSLGTSGAGVGAGGGAGAVGSSTVPIATTTTGAPVAAAAPRLRISSAAVDFGSTADRWELALANDGGAPLAWSAAVTNRVFRVEPAGGSIPAGGAAQLAVFLDRSSLPEGRVIGAVRITSNGGAAEAALEGLVVRPPRVVRASAGDPRLVTSPCSTTPTATPVEALVEDESRIESVMLRWRSPSGADGQKIMQERSGGLYSGRLGPFDAAGTVVWWVEAMDSLGATGRSLDQTTSVATCPSR